MTSRQKFSFPFTNGPSEIKQVFITRDFVAEHIVRTFENGLCSTATLGLRNYAYS